MGLRPLVRAAKYVDPVECLAFAADRLNGGRATGPGASRRDAALDARSKMLFSTLTLFATLSDKLLRLTPGPRVETTRPKRKITAR